MNDMSAFDFRICVFSFEFMPHTTIVSYYNNGLLKNSSYTHIAFMI